MFLHVRILTEPVKCVVCEITALVHEYRDIKIYITLQWYCHRQKILWPY